MQNIQIHIADIHFGAIDPIEQYNILHKQFILPLWDCPFDILSIDGDLFDRKFIASSMAVEMAIKFVTECAQLCEYHNAALILISGTESHEAGQLSLFKELGNISTAEIYIVEHASFVYTHDLKILCLPEEYGKGYEYYAPLLNQIYDCCFMHGTIAGGVYGCNEEDLNARRPVFDLSSFIRCKGPIIAGHVHEHMCLKQYIYYVSNPIRYKFGEEGAKGYGIVLMNDNGHYYQFMEIDSYDYKTIQLKIESGDNPDEVVNKINELASSINGKLRIQISADDDITARAVSQYYQQSKVVKIEMQKQNKDDQPDINTTEDILDKYSGMDYLMDPSMSSYDKLARYINDSVGDNFVSGQELKNIYEAK